MTERSWRRLREKNQYHRKCSGQFNKEKTQGALLRQGVFVYRDTDGIVLLCYLDIFAKIVNQCEEVSSV